MTDQDRIKDLKAVIEAHERREVEYLDVTHRLEAALERAMVLLNAIWKLADEGVDCHETDGSGNTEDGAYIGKAVKLPDDLDEEIIKTLDIFEKKNGPISVFAAIPAPKEKPND